MLVNAPELEKWISPVIEKYSMEPGRLTKRKTEDWRINSFDRVRIVISPQTHNRIFKKNFLYIFFLIF